MIHPTAILDPTVELGEGVEIGPYVVIQGNVKIGPATRILPHCVIQGNTLIGARCLIGPAAYIGQEGQHLTYDRSLETHLVVGDDCVIREGVTLNRSTKAGIENATTIGHHCFFMANSHVGHDCKVGNHVILANAVLLGGHVTVGDRAFLGGGCAIHQFCRVGRLAVIRGNDAVSKDAPPFCASNFNHLKGYNAVGVRRAGLSRDSIASIRAAYHALHLHRVQSDAVAAIQKLPQTPELTELLNFLTTSKRGILPSARSNLRALQNAALGSAED